MFHTALDVKLGRGSRISRAITGAWLIEKKAGLLIILPILNIHQQGGFWFCKCERAHSKMNRFLVPQAPINANLSGQTKPPTHFRFQAL